MTVDDWSDAPCTNVDTATFFPDHTNAAFHEQVQAALRLCAVCPSATKVMCAQRAVECGDFYGIRAGVYMPEKSDKRRPAIAELRKIAGIAARKSPKRTPSGLARPCAGDCGRTIRPSNASLADYPGTLNNRGGWRCKPCLNRDNETVRGAA